jgi:prephenate dehydrogenase
LRDTTRVAAGDPAMWADIVIANRDALAAPLREAVAGLNELVGLLDAANPEAVRAWLAAAKSRRDMIQ